MVHIAVCFWIERGILLRLMKGHLLMEMIRKGFFVTFEGPECAGKTTQIGLLRERFASDFPEMLVTREPGGTELGEELRQIVKHHITDVPVTNEAELLLFSASRAQHVSVRIKPALERGCLVLCDRFFDSTTAYQGYARGLDLGFIGLLNDFAVGDCMPDLTVLLDLPAEESLERSLKREEKLFVEDRFDSETLEFHRKVREGFLRIARKNSRRIKVVSAMDPIQKIHGHIANLISDALQGKSEILSRLQHSP